MKIYFIFLRYYLKLQSNTLNPQLISKSLSLTICTSHRYHIFLWLTLFVESSWMGDKPFQFQQHSQHPHHHHPPLYTHTNTQTPQTPLLQMNYAARMTGVYTTKKGPLLLKLQIKRKCLQNKMFSIILHIQKNHLLSSDFIELITLEYDVFTYKYVLNNHQPNYTQQS